MLVANIGVESAAMKLSDLVCWTWPQNVQNLRPTSLKQLVQALKEGYGTENH